MIANVKIDKLPQNIDEFIALRDSLASTPQGGAAIFILALKMFAENPEVGAKCLVISVSRNKLQAGTVYKGFQISNFDMARIKEQIRRFPYIANSYFAGTNAETKYNFTTPVEIECSENPYSGDINSGEFKLFVKSSGADSPRPIFMTRNNRGVWKATEWSTILMGIVPAKEDLDDDI